MPAVHLEFVVAGPPISNQQSSVRGKANLTSWRARVEAEARAGWTPRPLLAGSVRVTLLNFHSGDLPSVDVDNMSKPIHDVMNGVVYGDDRQIRQAEIAHLRIDSPLVLAGVSKALADAVQVGQPFVYVRVEDVRDPYPLPR